MAQSRVRWRRSSQAVCDSLFCTVAVVAPVAFSLAYYRNDLRQLLRALFLIGILFGALLTLRHALRRARLRLREWLKTKEEEVVGEYSRHLNLCSMLRLWSSQQPGTIRLTYYTIGLDILNGNMVCIYIC